MGTLAVFKTLVLIEPALFTLDQSMMAGSNVLTMVRFLSILDIIRVFKSLS